MILPFPKRQTATKAGARSAGGLHSDPQVPLMKERLGIAHARMAVALFLVDESSFRHCEDPVGQLLLRTEHNVRQPLSPSFSSVLPHTAPPTPALLVHPHPRTFAQLFPLPLSQAVMGLPCNRDQLIT